MAKPRANGEGNIRKRKGGRWEEELAGTRDGYPQITAFTQELLVPESSK